MYLKDLNRKIMRYFTIVRHAKSSWAAQGLSDHERPLNERGQRDAPRMATWLARTLYKPQALVVSSAVRAQETGRHFQERLSLAEANYINDSRLYLAGMKEWIEVLQDALQQNQDVAFFAHNPGVTNIINWLADESIFDAPTCAVAVIAIADDCERIDSGVGKLIAYKTPKTLEID